MHNKKNNKIVLIILILILCISIGYAFLSTVLKINSNLSLNKILFDIHFDNVVPSTSKAIVSEDAHLVDGKNNEISFSATLAEVGDYYRFTTDVVNDSTIPGKLKSIDLTGLTDSQKKLIKYTIYYTNTKKEVKNGDYLKQNNSKNITVELKYKLDSSITNEDIPTDNITLDCSLVIDYENADIDELNDKMIMNQISEGVEFYPTSLLHFTQGGSSSDPSGLYVLDDTVNDTYPIYFYRGGNNLVYNHLIFADYCWRIIRTTDTGGTKIIYNGTPNADGQCLNTNPTDVAFSFGKFSNSSASTWEISNAKNGLDRWYFNNLKQYEDYIDDTHFCRDDKFTTGSIDLSCDEENIISVQNGRNTYPIGIVSAEDLTLTGFGNSTFSWLSFSQYFFLMNLTNDNYYCLMISTGNTFTTSSTAGTSYIRAVISLNNEVTITSGDGTKENPYRVGLI